MVADEGVCVGAESGCGTVGAEAGVGVGIGVVTLLTTGSAGCKMRGWSIIVEGEGKGKEKGKEKMDRGDVLRWGGIDLLLRNDSRR